MIGGREWGRSSRRRATMMHFRGGDRQSSLEQLQGEQAATAECWSACRQKGRGWCKLERERHSVKWDGETASGRMHVIPFLNKEGHSLFASGMVTSCRKLGDRAEQLILAIHC